MASSYFPPNKLAWRDRRAPTLADFERLAAEAYRRLPPEFTSWTGEIIIRVEEFPDEDVADSLALDTPFDLLGLFEGRGIGEKFNPYSGELPNKITLFRRAILDYWSESEETLGDIITHVLVHEIGHHFGLSDDDLTQIEERADMGATH